MTPLTPTHLRVLRRAAGRPDGHVCPTPGLRGAGQTAVLRTLEAHGLITARDPVDDSLAPTITLAGRVAIAPTEPAEAPSRCDEGGSR